MFFYQGGVSVRNLAYDRGWMPQERLSCRVISVGNLTLGGTGKTACVERLASKVQQLGQRVAILSRGYGGRQQKPYWLVAQAGQVLRNGHTGTDGLPDEPQLLALHLPGTPILVGARREQTGSLAVAQFQTGVVILDDGFQYRRLHRDCEVVLINARMPLGGWPLFPRGPMREPLASLRRADVIIVTKVDQSLELAAAMQERLRSVSPTAIIATAVHEPLALKDGVTSETLSLDLLSRGRVSLLSSIGDPDGFEQTVRRMGATVVSHAAYPDHYAYQRQDWHAMLHAASRDRAEALVTTEKDWIRLQPYLEGMKGTSVSVPVWVLRIQMRFLSGEEHIDARLAAVCAR